MRTWTAAVFVVAGVVAVLAPGHAGAVGPATDCLASVGGVDLQLTDIAGLRAALAAHTITSVQLVDAYVARISAYDRGGPLLNAVRDLNVNARTQAASLDDERAAGHVRGPLHGIPVLLKDNVGTSDEPTTAGSIALANNVPAADATLTKDLRDAGAVILGKTNLSEFANWVSLQMPNGYSSLGGQVINAYTGGDPSGSSAGSGVAGSMAMAAATIGTETSGSILSPSNVNSLVGVKPTVGLVSRAGVIPLAGSFDTPGPMTRSVADAAVMLSAIAGPDPRDPATAASGAHLPPNHDYVSDLHGGAASLAGVRLGYEANGNPLFVRALDDLRAQGATLVPIMQRTSLLADAGLPELGLIPNEFKFGINDYLAHEAGPGLPVSDLTGIILYNRDHSDRVKYGQDLLIASDASPGVGAIAPVAATPVIAANQTIIDTVLAQNQIDAIVAPGVGWVSAGAAAGYPTVIVPAGYAAQTPQGVSFTGTAWSESRLLEYAYAYEQASMRRVPPTTMNPSLLIGVCP